MEEIENKVANSGIITIDPEEFYTSGERVVYDIKPMLFKEIILKEKDFREEIKNTDWSKYKNKLVAIICTADAVIPTWAYMLLTLAMEPYAKKMVFGDIAILENELFSEKLAALNLQQYKDARIVIKGCGEKNIPTNVYVKLTAMLKPIAKSIMYGEPCSTVPLFKAPKN
ncbi:MAG: DUF2480 family protein [Bacteroidia bacterium]|nr:DUF2480 family protein [Sphingobacteriaceae bacterium]MBK7817938.1 DUF2480 family protein [Sphingobacteriaceae bacterium]MBP9068148.1 DUF2480 family protein [Bacteroidia bacterium]